MIMASQQKWGRLAPPVDPLDNTYLARAISLTGRRDISPAEARAIIEAYDGAHEPLTFWQRTNKRIKSWRSSK